MQSLVQHFFGLVLAVGLMAFAAVQLNAQIIRECRIHQEVSSCHR